MWQANTRDLAGFAYQTWVNRQSLSSKPGAALRRNEDLLNTTEMIREPADRPQKFFARVPARLEYINRK